MSYKTVVILSGNLGEYDALWTYGNSCRERILTNTYDAIHGRFKQPGNTIQIMFNDEHPFREDIANVVISLFPEIEITDNICVELDAGDFSPARLSLIMLILEDLRFYIKSPCTKDSILDGILGSKHMPGWDFLLDRVYTAFAYKLFLDNKYDLMTEKKYVGVADYICYEMFTGGSSDSNNLNIELIKEFISFSEIANESLLNEYISFIGKYWRNIILEMERYEK